MIFYKYHGTGNDFILVDNRNGALPEPSREWVEGICHRRFGIGADGFILLTRAEGFDFGMDYFNSDGRRSSMCGNGGRCITQLAASLGIISAEARFTAPDGPHVARLTQHGVSLQMGMPAQFEKLTDTDFFIHTGSPHFVRFVEGEVKDYPVETEGRKIRNLPRFAPGGTNANFVNRLADGSLFVRTYERGVEAETWSCGTGATAVAEVFARIHPGANSPVLLHTPGGDLRVHVTPGEAPWLEGPAVFVYSGELPPLS